MFTNPGSRADLQLTPARLALPDTVRRADQPVAAATLIAIAISGVPDGRNPGFASDDLRHRERRLAEEPPEPDRLPGDRGRAARTGGASSIRDVAARPEGSAPAACRLSGPVRPPFAPSTIGCWFAGSGSRGRLADGPAVGRRCRNADHDAGRPDPGVDSRPSGGDPVSCVRLLGRRCAQRRGRFVVTVVVQAAILGGTMAFGGELRSSGVTRAIKKSAALGASRHASCSPSASWLRSRMA